MFRFLKALLDELLPAQEVQPEWVDGYRTRLHRLDQARWELIQETGTEPSVTEIYARSWSWDGEEQA